ncbi:MAG: tetratricopeptide repeat protein [Bacteroidales bacterium]|nr:tetratricopeptide repeat protein [Bacteroidales bacterium]
MELNKKKYREYLVNVLNFVFDTNSFTVNSDKDTQKLYQVVSDELKTVVNINFEIDKYDVIELIDNMFDVIKGIEKDTNIESLIFVSYTFFDDALDHFYEIVDDNSRLEIDVWDMDILNNYFEAFHNQLDIDSFDIEAFDFRLNNFPEIHTHNNNLFEKTFKNLDQEFFKNKNQICVLFNNMIASGKTSAAIDYANSRSDKFQHIAFIHLHGDIRIDFVNAFANSNLGFKYDNKVNLFQNYYELLSTLNLFSDQQDSKVQNLLIFDQITNIKEIAIISEIAKTTGFKILLTSLSKSVDFANVELAIPNDDKIFEIISSYVPEANIEDVLQIFEPIDNNLFFVKFLGTQIKNNPKIYFKDFTLKLLAKEKKIYKLGTYLSPNLPQNITTKHQILLKYIMAVYEEQVKDFSALQKQILTLISVLPQINLVYDDLFNFLKINSKNADDFINELIDLQRKGWLETTKKNIYTNNNVKKILHKKLKPSSSNLHKTIKYLTAKILDSENINFFDIIVSENLIHSLVSVNEKVVDLIELISISYTDIGYFDRSEYFSELAADFYEKVIEIKQPSVENYNRLIRFCILAKDYEKALYYNQTAYELSIEEFGESSEETANVALNMAIILENMQDYFNAISYIEIALDILEQYYDQDEDPLLFATEIHDLISEKIESKKNVAQFNKFMINFFDKDE